MKTIPLSFDYDVTGEVIEYVDTSATKIGDYPLGILVGAIGKILSDCDENFNDTNITFKTVAPVKGNPCPYPALVVSGNEIEIIIAPDWDAGEPPLEVKYSIGSIVVHEIDSEDFMCRIQDIDVTDDDVILYCEALTGKHTGSCFAVNQNDIKMGVTI